MFKTYTCSCSKYSVWDEKLCFFAKANLLIPIHVTFTGRLCLTDHLQEYLERLGEVGKILEFFFSNDHEFFLENLFRLAPSFLVFLVEIINILITI